MSKKPPRKDLQEKAEVEVEIGNQAKPIADAYSYTEDFFPFNKQHINFLVEYQKDLDFGRAAREAGFNPRTRAKAKDLTTDLGQALAREMKVIHDAWKKALALNPQAAAAKHVDLMEKFERDYDGFEDKNKAAMAGSLAKMSDTSLKATGQFSKDGESSGTKVEINIDLSSNKIEPVEVVDGE